MYQDRLYQLRLALAQATEHIQKEQIQVLIGETRSEYEAYLAQYFELSQNEEFLASFQQKFELS